MTRAFRLIALTPPASYDPGIAIAASRAGELGVLDLEHSHDRARAHHAIATLATHAHAPFGVRVRVDDVDIVTSALDSGIDLLQVVILIGPTTALPAAVAALQSTGQTVLVEATSMSAARAAIAAGAAGLVAKGHEAGGRVGDEPSFILLQQLLSLVEADGSLQRPIYVHGGIGLHTAAACYVAGAAGVVLDMQLGLTRESPLPERIKERLAAMDGSETMTLGTRLGAPYRLYARPGLTALDELRREELRLDSDDARQPQLAGDGGPNTSAAQPYMLGSEDRQRAWCDAVERRIGWGAPSECVYPLGQDGAFAASLAERFVTVAGVLAAMRGAVVDHCTAARDLHPLDEQAALAQSHGTRYPIVQGPMTRVSDVARFALAVADGGGLPFLALALMHADEVRTLLRETKSLLGEQPWGVGILGFVSPELRQEQIEVIREMRPPWALIAGGRPAQAQMLEQDGIPAYLHVPSPGLLKMFLQDSARRFVFEGRECGGHVGPRTSFVLWNTMIDVLLQTPRTARDQPIDVLFAGGIHDARSAAMVAAMAAPLVQRGMRIGVLMGTSYLFTEEAVASGAIMPAFQQEALACTRTALLESGPGHATRCVETPFVGTFEAEQRRLLATGADAEEVRAALEDLNVGRLRIASKGITRNPGYGQDADAPKFVTLSEEEQRAEGMYMIGQAAMLRDRVTTIATLHHDVCAGGTAVLDQLGTQADEIMDAPPPSTPADVAIIGVSALLPKAEDARVYWENILAKLDAITEVPPDRWDWRRYFDEDKAARDRVYSRWGGFLDDIPFDPLSYGMPPNSLHSIEPLQLLMLEAVRAAFDDAGYLQRPFPRERTAVILGTSGVSDLGLLYGVRSTLPSYLDGEGNTLHPALAAVLPEWTEDSFAGMLMNVTAGRVTNRFDLGGANFTVDAACASSLAAVSQGVKELQLGSADMVVAGGADTAQNALAFMAFSKTHALSSRGRCRPFDAAADGIAISEGAAVVILKRLADAERDGDRVYAVIKGVGSSSDGRDKSLTAPRPEGQIRALERAYQQAGFSPATVGLVEAHGTGTVVGDKTEVTSLSAVFQAAGATAGGCAIGSVKSLIGHTKAAAGVASLVKVALALYHRTLPPTLVDAPNPSAGFGENPFYVNAETRPWLNGTSPHPRRAGVSAFGFGGTNFHIALEEHTAAYLPAEASLQTWPSELLLFRANSRETLRDAIAAVATGLDHGAQPRLLDLAYSLARAADSAAPDDPTVAIIASSLADLRAKLQTAIDGLATGGSTIHDPRGVYATARPLAREGEVAFLFPGQGSQYVNMSRDIAVMFPEVRDTFEQANHALAEQFPAGLGSLVFPAPAFEKEASDEQQRRLTATDVAQPALAAANLAMLRLLDRFAVRPASVAGHSYGEFVALHAAGVFDAEALFHLSAARGRFMAEAAGAEDPGTMAAVAADAETVASIVGGLEGVVLANLNAPAQTVISGTTAGVAQAIERLTEQGLRARRLPVSCAFHSPVIAGARDRLGEVVAAASFAPPRLPVYSNTTSQPYPTDPREGAALLSDHLVSPVRFTDEIEAMYAAGARLFIEVGPRNVLSGLVDAILGERPHLCIATDQPGRSGLTQLQHALAQMAAQGVRVALDRLFDGRGAARIDVRGMGEHTGRRPLSPTTWLVNGGYARPMSEQRRVVAPVGQVVDPRTAQIQQWTGLNDSSRMAMMANSAVADGVREDAGIGGGMEVHVTDVLNDNGAGGAGFEPIPPQPTGDYPHNGHNGSTHTAAPLVAPLAPAAAPNAYGATPGAPVAPPAAGPAAYPDEISVTVMQFQQVMTQFLETQRAVMAAYFGQAAAVPPVLPGISAPAAYVPAPAYLPPPTIASPSYLPAAPVAPAPAYTVPQTYAAPVPPPLPTAGAAAVDPPQPAPVVTGGPVTRMQVTPAAATLTVNPTSTRNDEAPAATQGTTSALTEDELTQRLLAIVGERTGYPTEMLGLDLDLEADLGIDSIKRVEIVGSLRRVVAEAAGPSWQIPDGAMEKLSAVKTLRAVVAGMMEILGGVLEHPPPAGATGRAATADGQPSTIVDSAAVPRFVLRATTAPPASKGQSANGGSILIEGAVVVTDDEHGIAIALTDELRQRGHTVVVLRVAPKNEAPVDETLVPDVSVVDVTDPNAVAAVLNEIRRRHGRIGAVVHLAPLRGVLPDLLSMDLVAWKRRVATDVKSLYYLAHQTGPDVLAPMTDGTSSHNKGLFIAATGLGGTFGLERHAGASPPATVAEFSGHGAIPGFLKTLGLEWPGVQVKAVDLDLAAPVSSLVQQLREEMFASDDEIAVGRQGSRRVVVDAVSAPLAVDGPTALTIDPSSVILVTGGARGITAGVALELARRFRPTLLLAGRSPLPASEEPAETAGLTAPREIKAAIIARMRDAGETPQLARVEASYNRLLQDREMRATLADLAATGATVHYFAVDVRDEQAFGSLIDGIYDAYGRLDGVIHGAGIIEDKLVLDKVPESFDRVFDTKADSAFVLARKLRPESLRFLAFFASVTACFGNRGQADYGAANDLMNVLARELDARWPGRVVSFNWGPWGRDARASGGMVDAETEAQFRRRGVELIQPEIGYRRAIEELLHGRKGDVALVYGSGPWSQGQRRMPGQ